jgi:hypothetical protein
LASRKPDRFSVRLFYYLNLSKLVSGWNKEYMENQNNIKVFEDKKVRTLWDEEQEKWYFSIVDVIAVLTDSPNPRKYWSVLKTRLKAEGSQLTTNCSQLKMN